MRIQVFLLIVIFTYASETRKHPKHRDSSFEKSDRKLLVDRSKLGRGHGKGNGHHHKNLKKLDRSLIVDKDTWLSSPHLKYKKGICSAECAEHEICVQDFKADKAVCVAKQFLKKGRKLVRKFNRNHFDNHKKDGKDHGKGDKHGFRKNIRLPIPYDAKDGWTSYMEKPKDLEMHVPTKHKSKLAETKSVFENLNSEKNTTNYTTADCQPEDMQEMKKRLTGWYALLHTESREKMHWFKKHKNHGMRSGRKQFRTHSVPSGQVFKKHHEKHGSCECVKSVMWEMRHLDQNLDHYLNQTELKQVERNSKEPCILPFLQSCDANLDSRLSKHEWCCCFADVVPPCYAAVRKLKDNADKDAFVPRCDIDGYFRKTQCEKSTGYCWCVDLNGNELPESRTKEHPHCGKFDSLGYKKIE